LEFLDYEHEYQQLHYSADFSNGNSPRLVKIDSYTVLNRDGNGTGWNISEDKIAFGQCGVVAGWWKDLQVEFSLGLHARGCTAWTLTIVKTDSVNPPFKTLAAFA